MSTGQGFIGNNMFAYCGNNPVTRIDDTGQGWGAIVLGAVAGVVISYIGSLVTGEKFTWLDAVVGAFSGAVGAGGKYGCLANGLINGFYSAGKAYKEGASVGRSIGIGLISMVFGAVSFGNLSNSGKDMTGVLISGFIDLVFGTGFGSMDAAISKALIQNTQNTTQSSQTSAIDIIMRKKQSSKIRIYNGQVINVGSGKHISRGPDYDPNKLYCYVEL